MYRHTKRPLFRLIRLRIPHTALIRILQSHVQGFLGLKQFPFFLGESPIWNHLARHSCSCPSHLVDSFASLPRLVLLNKPFHFVTSSSSKPIRLH